MSLRKAAINGVKWTTLGSVIVSLLKLLQVSILARYLNQGDFGIIAIVLFFVSFADIFLETGIASGIMYHKNITRGELSSLYFFNAFVGLVLLFIFGAISPLVASYYKAPELGNLIFLIGISIFFSSFSRVERTFLQKELEFKFIMIVEVMAASIMLLTSYVLASHGYGTYSLVIAAVINSLFLGIIFTIKGIYSKNIFFHFKLGEIKRFLRLGIYQLQSSVLDFFSRELDIVIISNSYSIEMLGAYSLCKQIASKVYGILNPILLKVLTPLFSLMRENIKEIKNKYLLTIEILSFINFPIYFLLALLSSEVLNIFYGTQYEKYHFILIVLAINYSILSIGNPVGALQIALGKTKLGLYWTIFRITSVVFFMGIGQFFNFEIFICFILINNLFNIIPAVKLMIAKMIPITIWEYFRPQAKSLIFSLLLLGLLYSFKLFSSPILNIAVLSLVFGGIYLLSSYLFNRKILNLGLSIFKKN